MVLVEMVLVEEGWEDYGLPSSEWRMKLTVQVAERAGIGEVWSSARGTREQSRGTDQDVREERIREKQGKYRHTLILN